MADLAGVNVDRRLSVRVKVGRNRCATMSFLQRCKGVVMSGGPLPGCIFFSQLTEWLCNGCVYFDESGTVIRHTK